MNKLAIKFEIFYVTQRKKPTYLIARIIDNDIHFSLSDQSRLAGFPVEPVISQPRAVDKEGKPRMDLFVFFLSKSALNHFKVGQIVELVTEGITTNTVQKG